MLNTIYLTFTVWLYFSGYIYKIKLLSKISKKPVNSLTGFFMFEF